ncbi:YfhO family protein [bacterium]|nr:YfhO family protein [bacterium]
MKKNIPAVLILSLLISIFFWKFFLFGYLPLPSDILRFYWPPWKMASLDEIPKNPLLSDALDTLYSIAHYSQEIIKDGRLSLWNPHTFCGIPMFAFFTFSLLHPLSYLSYLFSPQETYALTIMLQLFLAGLFMYLFLRISLKIGRFGALVGSTVFMFNGVFMVWLEFITTIGSALYFPLIFLLIDKTISKKSLTYSLLGAILLAIVIFSSHLQNLLYLILAFFFYALFRILLEYRQKRHFRQLARPILLVVASFVLGILLSFIYLLPLFEQTTLCHRSEFKFKELNPLPVANLVTFVIPDFYGTPAPPHSYGAVRGWFYKTGLIKERPVKVGGENYNEYCGYIGVLPLILALLAGLLRKDRDSRFFFGFFVVSLLLALGTFLYLPLYWFAPGFNKMGISRIVFLFCFSGSILTGMGAEEVGSGKWEVGKLQRNF